MRTSLKKRNSIPLWMTIFILVIAIVLYMIYAIFSNFETPLNKLQYIKNGQQYNTIINENDLVCYSNTFLGMQYLWGGTTPVVLGTTGKYISGGFDCSGFVQYVYKKFGVNLPRTSMDQVNKGVSVKINDLEKGDLVFFMTNSALPHEVSHVGIYIGNNKFIHSPNTYDVIKISALTGYYKDKFVIGKRMINYMPLATWVAPDLPDLPDLLMFTPFFPFPALYLWLSNLYNFFTLTYN